MFKFDFYDMKTPAKNHSHATDRAEPSSSRSFIDEAVSLRTEKIDDGLTTSKPEYLLADVRLIHLSAAHSVIRTSSPSSPSSPDFILEFDDPFL